MKQKPQVTYVVAKNLTEEQIAEARQALMQLARILGRAIADGCHKLGVAFDMDDPQVVRDLITVTFEALVYSKPRRGKDGV